MSNSNRPYLSFFVIEHAGHGSAALEEQRHGGQHYRFLNATGRWSARGTRAVPLLAWTDRQEVEAAAAVASKARDRVFKVSSLGGDSLVAEQFAAFSERHAEALLGYLPYATAAARKLEELRVKTINRVFLGLTRTLRREGATPENLARQLREQTGDSTEWPSDERFGEAWRTQHAYHLLNNPKIVHILKRLSDTYLTGKSEAVTVEGALSVEHLLPSNGRRSGRWLMAQGA